jgi:hypothetical protein
LLTFYCFVSMHAGAPGQHKSIRAEEAAEEAAARRTIASEEEGPAAEQAQHAVTAAGSSAASCASAPYLSFDPSPAAMAAQQRTT